MPAQQDEKNRVDVSNAEKEALQVYIPPVILITPLKQTIQTGPPTMQETDSGDGVLS